MGRMPIRSTNPSGGGGLNFLDKHRKRCRHMHLDVLPVDGLGRVEGDDGDVSVVSRGARLEVDGLSPGDEESPGSKHPCLFGDAFPFRNQAQGEVVKARPGGARVSQRSSGPVSSEISQSPGTIRGSVESLTCSQV